MTKSAVFDHDMQKRDTYFFCALILFIQALALYKSFTYLLTFYMRHLIVYSAFISFKLL